LKLVLTPTSKSEVIIASGAPFGIMKEVDLADTSSILRAKQPDNQAMNSGGEDNRGEANPLHRKPFFSLTLPPTTSCTVEIAILMRRL
jgi:hypothetical protein